MIDRGIGSPIVLVPGVQGRCEWMAPTIEALSVGHRVLSFSLGEVAPDDTPDGAFHAWIDGIDRLLHRAGEARAVIAGVSFGGLIAARYAARRPDKVSALVLVSAPPPRWTPDLTSQAYLKYPRLALPFFSIRGCLRLAPEIFTARPSWKLRLQLASEYAQRVVRAPIAPTRMARWVREWMALDIERDCRNVRAPALLITGEARLDRVVPVARSLEYLQLIPGTKHVVLPDTGHVGLITKPWRFAEAVDRFLDEAAAVRAAHVGRAGLRHAAHRSRHAS